MSRKAVCIILLLAVIAAFCACNRQGGSKIEKNAVIQNVTISPEEARDGMVKVVRAPDGEYYSMVIPKNTPNGKLLILPPKIAEKYPYPLYFKISVVAGGGEPADDLLHRKKQIGRAHV